MDFWADQNRGDAAMQAGIVKLVRRHQPSARLTVMAASGSNQWPGLSHQLTDSSALADDAIGGVRPWLFGPFKSGPLSRAPIRKVVSGLCVAAAVSMMVAWPVIRRVRWLENLLPRSTRNSVRAVRSADIVLWNCRNIRGQSYIREPYEVWGRLYNAIVAMQFGKPVACIGASIWPLRNPLSRFLARAVLRRTCFTSTRDASSYDYATALLGGKGTAPHLLPDLSLAVLAAEMPVEHELPPEPRRIGITLVDCNSGGSTAREAYIAAVRGFLISVLERDDTEVIVIPQVTNVWQSTEALERELTTGMDRSRISRVAGEPTVAELIAIYRGLDLLVATRMHSAIFALSQGTPTVTIPYIPGGKWGILNMMGARDIDVAYLGITAETLREKVESVWRRRLELVRAVRMALPAIGVEVEDNVKLPFQAYREM